MAKLEKQGCSKALVGLVVPSAYTFNADGTSLYMTLAALFVAEATDTQLSFMQQLTNVQHSVVPDLSGGSIIDDQGSRAINLCVCPGDVQRGGGGRSKR